MHISSNALPQLTTRHGHRGTLRLLRAVALAAAALCPFATAQEAGGPDEPIIIGLHYQDLLPHDGDTAQVFLPRPHTGPWDGVMLSSSDECLELGELGDPGAEYVLVLDVRLTGDQGGAGVLAPGAACSAAIVTTYSSGPTVWEGTTLIAINRLAHPPAPDGVIEAVLTLDRIAMPFEPGTRATASLVTLRLTNSSTAPVVLLGLADEAALTDIIGTVYQYDEPLAGTLADLEAKGRALAATTLAPGASTNIALLLDPGARLPDGSAVLTVQPALLVDIAGTTYSLRFERLSTAWGNELP